MEINPKHKGDFTAFAKAHGKSVPEMADMVMAHKEMYAPHVVQMANFAKNARSFNHSGPMKPLHKLMGK